MDPSHRHQGTFPSLSAIHRHTSRKPDRLDIASKFYRRNTEIRPWSAHGTSPQKSSTLGTAHKGSSLCKRFYQHTDFHFDTRCILPACNSCKFRKRSKATDMDTCLRPNGFRGTYTCCAQQTKSRRRCSCMRGSCEAAHRAVPSPWSTCRAV